MPYCGNNSSHNQEDWNELPGVLVVAKEQQLYDSASHSEDKYREDHRAQSGHDNKSILGMRCRGNSHKDRREYKRHDADEEENADPANILGSFQHLTNISELDFDVNDQ